MQSAATFAALNTPVSAAKTKGRMIVRKVSSNLALQKIHEGKEQNE
jgi:hypothetical protein